jgi:hypothetical protein
MNWIHTYRPLDDIIHSIEAYSNLACNSIPREVAVRVGAPTPDRCTIAFESEVVPSIFADLLVASDINGKYLASGYYTSTASHIRYYVRRHKNYDNVLLGGSKEGHSISIRLPEVYVCELSKTITFIDDVDIEQYILESAHLQKIQVANEKFKRNPELAITHDRDFNWQTLP